MHNFPDVNEEDIGSVYMTMRVDTDRIDEMPPLLRTSIADEYRQNSATDSLAIAARSWDMYREIIQLSFHDHKGVYHFMLCDGAPVDLEEHNIRVFESEEALVRAAWEWLYGFYGTRLSDGGHMYKNRILVGWRPSSDIWPVLINRAFQLRLPLYRSMIASPAVKWAPLSHLSDIAMIYMQGASFRKLPGLPDLLRFWGVLDRIPELLPADIEEAVCDRPIDVANTIELYLRGIRDAMLQYCDAEIKPEIVANVPPFDINQWRNRADAQ